ncbi:hypothetical protein J6590_029894 [Homalodisca vitripennis]|nr:hypothetical protein J6590_029894 [Homalodisca vitripennis]
MERSCPALRAIPPPHQQLLILVQDHCLGLLSSEGKGFGSHSWNLAVPSSQEILRQPFNEGAACEWKKGFQTLQILSYTKTIPQTNSKRVQLRCQLIGWSSSQRRHVIYCYILYCTPSLAPKYYLLECEIAMPKLEVEPRVPGVKIFDANLWATKDCSTNYGELSNCNKRESKSLSLSTDSRQPGQRSLGLSLLDSRALLSVCLPPRSINQSSDGYRMWPSRRQISPYQFVSKPRCCQIMFTQLINLPNTLAPVILSDSPPVRDCVSTTATSGDFRATTNCRAGGLLARTESLSGHPSKQ